MAIVTTLTTGVARSCPIEVECHISNGLPSLIIVGYANRAVEEARERLRAAFHASGFPLPPKRILINLAPADLPKAGSGFDLAMAVSILVSGHLIPHPAARSIVLGELGLGGEVKPVRGLVGALLAGRDLGFDTFYIPRANCQQAQLIPDITLIPITSLAELYAGLAGVEQLEQIQSDGHLASHQWRQPTADIDFGDIHGQHTAKRALQVAAAGGHHVLLSGPPGTGKTMLARALPSILPPLTAEEVLQITHLHSLSGSHYERLVTERPFRAPHHSASNSSILGGGSQPRPGEISLSHAGVLLLDEMPEFSRDVLESLRQPLEDHTITIARVQDSVTLPADFLLIGTANPCPCGFAGSQQTCTCSPPTLYHYRRKLSGPILDRIDLFVGVEPVKHRGLLQPGGNESSQAMLQRVIAARQRQTDRLNGKLNAHLSARELTKIARLNTGAKRMLDQSAEDLGLSARGYIRVARVARTVADLEAAADVSEVHMMEALQYRHQGLS